MRQGLNGTADSHDVRLPEKTRNIAKAMCSVVWRAPGVSFPWIFTGSCDRQETRLVQCHEVLCGIEPPQQQKRYRKPPRLAQATVMTMSMLPLKALE